MKLIIRRGRVVDPANGIDETRDLAVADGRLVAPSEIEGEADTVDLDAAGLVVAPGFIDVHVHLREPGQEEKEDIASGTAAAAAGGFTTVLPMPNTKPPIDSVDAVRDLERRVRESAVVRTLACACTTTGRKGRNLVDVRRLRAETEIVALTDDGDCVQDREVMRQAMTLAAEAGLPVMDHCEDRSLMGQGVMRAGAVASELGVAGMPSEVESAMVQRNTELCRETGAQTHLQHLSCRRSVELLRQGRREGLPLTAEATPHHLCLTTEALRRFGSNAKMNPPLGDETDRQALVEAVADGTIGIIATDHAPHTPAEKALGLADAPFGIIGLETAFPLCFSELCERGGLDLPTLIACFTSGPAWLLGLALGTLARGRPADLVVLDLAASYRIDLSRSKSKSRNSPFDGQLVTGKVLGTLFAGEWVFCEETLGKGLGIE